MSDDIIQDAITEPDQILISEEIVLTESMKVKLLEAIKGGLIDLKELVEIAFGPGYDGRSQQGRLVKAFLAEHGIKARSAADVGRRNTEVVLSTDIQDFVKENMKLGLGPHALAKLAFKNENLTPLHGEVRAVGQFMNKILGNEPEKVKEEAYYNPPRNFDHTLARVRKYVQNCPVDKDKLTQRDRRFLNALQGFMNNTRFVQVCRTYDEECDRILFEDRFVNYTWDKPDITAEEIDAYINLALDVVDHRKICERINHMSAILLGQTDARMSMTLAEAVKNAESERNQNVARQEKARKSLIGNREKRIAQTQSAYASLSNLVEIWKEEDMREKLINLAIKQEELLKEEIDRFRSMDDVIALIAGISPEEILHGKF